jgi:hypothetical protein
MFMVRKQYTTKAGVFVYHIVDEQAIAGDMTLADAEKVAALLNADRKLKTPKPVEADVQAAKNRKLGVSSIPGWESLRFNGQLIDPISGKPIYCGCGQFSCLNCYPRGRS